MKPTQLASSEALLESATRKLKLAQNNVTRANDRLEAAEQNHLDCVQAINREYQAVRTTSKVAPLGSL